jgi:NADPH-dependent glutamate synthase beta subunit-like oxidoreductase
MNLPTTAECDSRLYISRSLTTTEGNLTGTWRFVRPSYEEKTAPCSAACPAGEDIARIEMLAGRNLLRDAWETILRENPFPSVCGRVCFHPCEGSCNRAELDAPVAIHHLERHIGDHALTEDFLVPPALPDGRPAPDRKGGGSKRIAIAGAGPAGLSAAYFLARLGYGGEVFESEAEAGGLLRWGIPAYRLPTPVLREEIARLGDFGVRLRLKTPITKGFFSEAADRFDGLVIACGFGRSITPRVPGEEHARDGLTFLHDVRNGGGGNPGGTAAVIGGGNSAVDVARTLVRLGTRAVIVYRRRKQDMPAFGHEIEMALAEGVELRELLAPAGIERGENGLALTVTPMRVSEMETSGGRARVVPDGERTETLNVDHVFLAIGAEPADTRHVAPPEALHLGHAVFEDEDLPRVWAGDPTTPVQSVADAIGSGKQAAMALDTRFRDGVAAVPQAVAASRIDGGPAHSMEIYLNGRRGERKTYVVGFPDINADYFPKADRVAAPVLEPAARRSSFEEVESPLPADAALSEAARCFNCGICNDCDNCRLFCPEVAIRLEKTRCINYDYCKGCGICVTECPRSAMSLSEEAR